MSSAFLVSHYTHCFLRPALILDPPSSAYDTSASHPPSATDGPFLPPCQPSSLISFCQLSAIGAVARRREDCSVGFKPGCKAQLSVSASLEKGSSDLSCIKASSSPVCCDADGSVIASQMNMVCGSACSHACMMNCGLAV